MLSNIPQGMNQNSDVDLFKVLSSMPEENLESLKEEINNNFTNLPDTMLDQSAINYVKSEYEDIGINIEKLQNSYIIKTGLIML